jgi:predicted permease
VTDLNLAFRQLRKNPAFTAIAVLSLALGIGANTAIFSLVNDFLLRQLPVKNPDELVMLRTIEGARGRMSRFGENNGYIDPATGRFGSTSFSVSIFDRLRAQRSALSDIFAFAPFSKVNVLVDGQPELDVMAQYVSGTYYSGLGVPALIGRTVTADDDRPGAAAVAVLSYRFWTRRFNQDPRVLGSSITINRIPTTIVGVTPAGFDGAMQVGESADVSVPLAGFLTFQPDRTGRAHASYWWIRIMGRRAPGATLEQVRASLEPVFQETAREGWLADRALGSGADETMPDPPTLVAEAGGQGENDTRRRFAQPLTVLMVLVGLVLAAACANVANLFLARGLARRREVALRFALGAGRLRVIRQLFAESLLVACGGALLGMLLALWGRGLLLTLRPFGKTSVAFDMPIDGRVLGFTIAVAVITSLLFGLAPALGATRVDLSAQFQGGTRLLGGRGSARLTRTLMIVQVALSLVLLISTGLFARTLANLDRVGAGFDRHHLVLFRIDAVSAGYTVETAQELHTRIQERLQRMPGVRTVTYSSVALLAGVRQNKRIAVPGHAPIAGSSMIVNTNGLASNFFTAMQLPLLLGRGFTERDDGAAPPVAVVNQAFVKTYLEGANPIGRTITIGAGPRDQVEIVGLAADAKYTDLRGPSPATIYLPARQRPDGEADFAVRPASDVSGRESAAAAALFPVIRSAVREIDPSLPVLDLRTQEEQFDRLNAQELLFARLSGVFGMFAMALACVGLYGLISQTVTRRTGEIGLRLALGAAPARVLRMVLRESVTLLIAGIALGALAAYASGQVVTAMLFGLSASDPATYMGAAAALGMVCLAATLIPARRASRIDPMVALRVE